MQKKFNAIVGQSGGPTSAINATLAGVILEAAKSEEIGILYGAEYGIKGLMREDFINLTETFDTEEKIKRNLHADLDKSLRLGNFFHISFAHHFGRR